MGYTQKDLDKLGLVEVSKGVYKKRVKPEEIFTFLLHSIIEIPGIVAGLNGSDGLMRGHWSAATKQKDLYVKIINDHVRNRQAKKHAGAVKIRYIGYKSSLMDWDNFCASFKHIGDSLVSTGIIKEDNPKIVVQFVPEQIKCKRANQKVVVIITDI